MHVDSATVVGGYICPNSVKEDTVTANCIDLDPVPTHITAHQKVIRPLQREHNYPHWDWTIRMFNT